MSTHPQTATEKMIFRKTNALLGRHISVTPANSSMRHLAYGRILLNASHSTESFSTGNREVGFILLSGQASVTVDGDTFELSQYDAIYIPRDSAVAVTTNSSVDIAEFSADVDNLYPLQVVRFADISKNPGL
ncbi:MAG: 5-deoxy-glucuronate isomerase, partial [Candidatus Acidiferrum sp.]